MILLNKAHKLPFSQINKICFLWFLLWGKTPCQWGQNIAPTNYTRNLFAAVGYKDALNQALCTYVEKYKN